MSDRVRGEFHLERREMLHHQSSQIAVLAQGKQVLLVQGVHVRLSVLVDDATRDDDGPTLVGGSDTIDTEATRQAGD